MRLLPAVLVASLAAALVAPLSLAAQPRQHKVFDTSTLGAGVTGIGIDSAAPLIPGVPSAAPGGNSPQFAMDFDTAKKSAKCLLEIRDNYLKLEPYQHTHVAEYLPQYLDKYECVKDLAQTNGFHRRGRGFFYNVGKRLGLTRWGRPGARLRDWVSHAFGVPAGREDDYTCGQMPPAECVAAGFMYRCLGCCLGSDQSALESGCCNVCLFKVLLFGDDPTLGSIPVEVVQHEFGVDGNSISEKDGAGAAKNGSSVKIDSVISTDFGSFAPSSDNSPVPAFPTKIGHTEAALAAADMMLNLDGRPLTPEQIKELEEKRKREKAELEQVSNIEKFLRDNYKPAYLPDVQENDPSTKHTKFNLKPPRTKKELDGAKGVHKNAQKTYVWNGSGFDPAIIEQNGEIIDHGKIIDDATAAAAASIRAASREDPTAASSSEHAPVRWTGNGKLHAPSAKKIEPAMQREQVTTGGDTKQQDPQLQRVLVWVGNGKFMEADVLVGAQRPRGNARSLGTYGTPR